MCYVLMLKNKQKTIQGGVAQLLEMHKLYKCASDKLIIYKCVFMLTMCAADKNITELWYL